MPLLTCVLIVMIGVGITLPVLPLYVERLALGSGANRGRVGLHIGALTAAYPMMQLVFAPLWGRLSDRIGRRWLIILGIVGFAASQFLFGIANGLGVLYAGRLVGGALSSALLPAASAHIADVTRSGRRVRGMMSLSSAVGVGTLVGPAIGGLASRADVHVRAWGDHLRVDAFSVPFFLAAGLAIVALVIALARLPATHLRSELVEPEAESVPSASPALLLGAAAAGYLAVTMFEATFSLFAADLGFHTAEVGAAFTICGATMLVAQVAGVALVERHGEPRTIAFGFVLMSAGMAVFVVATSRTVVFAAVAALGAGMALLGPSLASALSRHGSERVGRAMGLQQSAQSLGQVAGAMIGVLLFGWSDRAPYVTATIILMIAGALLWNRRRIG